MTAGRFVGSVAWRDVQLTLTSRVPFLFDLLSVFAALTIYLFVGRFLGRGVDPDGAGFLAFVTAGIAAVQLQAAVIRMIQAVDREQASGGLEMLLIGPARPSVVVGALAAFPLARGFGFAVVALVVSRMVFGAEVTLGLSAWPGILVGLAGVAVGYAVVAMLCFGVVIALRQGPAAGSAFGLLLPAISGVYFPASLLPGALGDLAEISPLALAVDQLRSSLEGESIAIGDVVVMVVSLAVSLALTARLCDAVVDRARRRGTLGHN